jgi:hypothetical protein
VREAWARKDGKAVEDLLLLALVHHRLGHAD